MKENHIQLTKAWQELTRESHKRPKIVGVYPPKVVRLRELLPIASRALENIENKNNTDFYWIIYQKTMNFYYKEIKKFS